MKIVKREWAPPYPSLYQYATGLTALGLCVVLGVNAGWPAGVLSFVVAVNAWGQGVMMERYPPGWGRKIRVK